MSIYFSFLIQFILFLLMILIPLGVLFFIQTKLVKRSYLSGLILPILSGIVTFFMSTMLINIMMNGIDVPGSLLGLFFINLPTGILFWIFKAHQKKTSSSQELKKTLIEDLN